MRKATFTALFVIDRRSGRGADYVRRLTFSQNNYYGTARSIGMGNAMTAVGGDPVNRYQSGGIAVAGYSQFSRSRRISRLSSDELILQRLPLPEELTNSPMRRAESHQILDAEHRC